MSKHKTAWDVNLKKLGLLAGGCILLLVVGWLGYLQWAFVTYIDRTIPKYTGFSSYRITAKEHNDYEWFARLAIQPSDGDSLLRKYAFKPGFSRAVLGGKSSDASPTDCSGCWYYIDNKNGSAYNYVLFILGEDKKQLLIEEVFGS